MSGLYICTKRKRPDLIYPKSILINRDVCRRCGEPYSWQIGQGRQYENPTSEEQDNRTRAAALFAEYRKRGIGPCCANPEHRNFISQHSGMVIYY